MVSAATEAAVNASISTPVRPVTLHVAAISMACLAGSGVSSTETDESANGWHRGIRSGVRLAPMIPASRATDSTSPFFTRPLSTRSRVSFAMSTVAVAVATRSVSGFSETSTMRAAPLVSKWLRVATGSHWSSGGKWSEQGASRRLDIGLAHQRLAHQEAPNARGGHPGEVLRPMKAALAHDEALGANFARQRLARGQIDLQRLEIAIVDADERRL